MDRVDRYILRQFIQTFLFGILAFVVIYVVVDLIENFDNFSDRGVPLGIAAKYYLFLTPEVVKLVTPIAMLLAGLFTTNKFTASHELTAIRSAGRSIRRTIVPFLIFGFVTGAALVWFNGWVVPSVNEARLQIDRTYLGRHMVGGASNVFLRVSPTLNLQMDYFDSDANVAQTVSLERLDSTATLTVPIQGERIPGQPSMRLPLDTFQGLAIVERIDAHEMRFDTTDGSWTMISGIARNLRDPSNVSVTTFDEREIGGLPITPEQLSLSQKLSEELTIPEMKARIDREKMGGRDITQLLIDYHSRFSYPFAAFIVVFFAIPYSSRQRKGGAAVPIALTALISAVYLVFTEVSQTLSFTADIPPVATAWMANGLFLLVGLLNLSRLR